LSEFDDFDLTLTSDEIKKVKREIIKASKVNLPVLIVGETGTGKEIIAHAIHNLSSRSNKPMIVVNISAIPPELFESELFGYEPGSFTSASRDGRIGKFELANGSSIFLDEIGDLTLNVQSKLLRVLQEGHLEKIGSKRLIKSDFRLISATNKDIEQLIAQGNFRMDLFYRINTITIYIPPLRERRLDIPILVQYFIDEYNAKFQPRIKVESANKELIEKLMEYDWPGNVRELQNEIYRACSFTNKEYIDIEDLSERLKAKLIGVSNKRKAISLYPRERILRETEKEVIINALKKFKGNKSKAAKYLGMSRTLLYKKIKDYDLS